MADADAGAEPNSKLEYFSVLDGILRTNPKKKLDNVLQRISERQASKRNNNTAPIAGGGDNDQEDSPRTGTAHKLCTISQVIKCNQHCISQIQIVRDNLLSAFMATTELNSKSKSATENITRQLSIIVGRLINLVSEASSLTQRIHENATGLHIAVDFFRDPKELAILDFSNAGRIPLSHFSTIEATSMCLAWIHSATEKLADEEATTTEFKPPHIRNNFAKIFKCFERAMADLCEAAELTTHIFRVLLYCNSKGKEMLQEYVKRLKPQEVNDLITEIQMMRRQFDEINILMDRLGWSLADIWGRCSGKDIRFEDIRKEGFLKLKNFEELERAKKNGTNKSPRPPTSPAKGSSMSKILTKPAQSEDKMLKKSKAQSSLILTKKKGTKPKQSKSDDFFAKLKDVLGKPSSDLSILENGPFMRPIQGPTRGGRDHSFAESRQIVPAVLPPKGSSTVKVNKPKTKKGNQKTSIASLASTSASSRGKKKDPWIN